MRPFGVLATVRSNSGSAIPAKTRSNAHSDGLCSNASPDATAWERANSISAPIHATTPRVRGNLLRTGSTAAQIGSIPACAGEPSPGVSVLVRAWVYPRVCGGTSPSGVSRQPWTGLSPRVRGNQGIVRGATERQGSIPACAGEPASDASNLSPLRVYPRVCGGTGDPQRYVTVTQGLSPRVRGNPSDVGSNPRLRRSIPACAGEPRAAIPGSFPPWVYPRVCGGTSFETLFMPFAWGLSPRVRGNPNNQA